MITDEDARALVRSLHEIAARNIKERDRYESEYWQGQSDGRNSAYILAAEWLKNLIKEADSE